MWSFAKLPRSDFSLEENARLLSVYMRPWTLNPQESVGSNPLLSVLGRCYIHDHGLVPVWSCLQSTSVSNIAGAAHAAPASDIPGAAQARPESAHAAIETACRVGPLQKRFRLRKKVSGSSSVMPERISYATSWETYVDGHIVSKSSMRSITNLLAATAASGTEQSDDSSENSDVEALRNLDLQVGHMDLVHQTLRGIAARSADEGEKVLGRHAQTIRLGRSL